MSSSSSSSLSCEQSMPVCKSSSSESEMSRRMLPYFLVGTVTTPLPPPLPSLPPFAAGAFPFSLFPSCESSASAPSPSPEPAPLSLPPPAPPATPPLPLSSSSSSSSSSSASSPRRCSGKAAGGSITRPLQRRSLIFPGARPAQNQIKQAFGIPREPEARSIPGRPGAPRPVGPDALVGDANHDVRMSSLRTPHRHQMHWIPWPLSTAWPWAALTYVYASRL